MGKLILRTFSCFVFIIGLSLNALSISQARVIFKEKTTYYNVSGKNGAELYRSMEKNGPKHGGGNKNVLAATSFTFDFKNARTVEQGSRCKLKSIDIIVGVTYTYPKLRSKKGLSKNSRKAWANFLKVAVKHEKQHVKITRKFITDYEKILLKSKRRSYKNCARPSLAETFKSNRILRAHERQHRRFDKTDLGRGGTAYKALQRLVNAN